MLDGVGIRDLKAHLSHYLKRVQAGAHVTVTDRGRIIATIAPAGAAPDPPWTRDVIVSGRARWNGGKPAGLAGPPARGRRASAAVLEDRR